MKRMQRMNQEMKMKRMIYLPLPSSGEYVPLSVPAPPDVTIALYRYHA